ncbi:7-cyano-7-deazaguanine synthase in queuosine biosynthesis [Prosthecobacter fusiformis]|uniref:7-cyano-7-deazaguanine synthase in queuosine biosynthesis n=1 Tax=Prosthecobacter fusiformis TaxID=48464 RepID=A0A4R7RI93_9BACT|nr:Qat anti-phage system QueC-like protein QatC [Prosthecobacter fusiformis]TDU62095.1 7-cyano-7-deazaguanine synthase in queuosine biosynthesis [Prosthecobacter fusiformis]
MKVEVQIHPVEALHEFAKTELVIASLDAKLQLDLNIEPFLKFSWTASPVVLDLLLISAVVYAADKAISREHFEDRWTRTIDVSIPVHDADRWNSASELLAQSISFLTGDHWRFEFVSTTSRLIRRRRNRRSPKGFPSSPVVSLLSGGLDSFIGALDLLSEHSNRFLFASHYDGKVPGPASDQDRLLDLLETHFPKRIRHLQMRIGVQKPERLSQPTSEEWQADFKFDLNFRSRSFSFLGIAILAASKVGANTAVWIPENGPIALNMPLNPSRRGSCSTRTVHPHFLSSIQKVLDAVGIQHEVSNPYALYTKGEMVRDCKAQELLKDGCELTNSCAKSGHNVHWDVRNAGACGRCVPCIFRRASLHVANLDNETYGYDVLKRDFRQDEDFYALLGLIRRNPSDSEIARILLANGRLPINQLNDYVAVESRMIAEVRQWLADKASQKIKNFVRIK